MKVSFFPLTIIIDPEFHGPVTPKAIEQYIYYLEHDDFHDDTHLLCSRVAQSLLDDKFIHEMMISTKVDFYTAKSFEFMTDNLKIHFIQSYCQDCFAENQSKYDWNLVHFMSNQDNRDLFKTLTRSQIKRLGYGYFSSNSIGFLSKMLGFISRNESIARYIFDNYWELAQRYFLVPDRCRKGITQSKTFDDLKTYVISANEQKERKTAGGLTKQAACNDHELQKLYGEYNALKKRNRRNNHYFNEERLNPQEEQDILLEKIAQREKYLNSKNNQQQLKTAAKTKDPYLAAKQISQKPICSSSSKKSKK